MKTLNVHLAYGPSFGLPGKSGEAALPFRVLDKHATVLAEAAVLAGQQRQVELDDSADDVYVRLSWPSGQTQTQQVTFSPDGVADVVFSEAKSTSGEWSAWAAPRLGRRRGVQLDGSTPPEVLLDRYAKVWLRFWSFGSDGWELARIKPDMQYKSDQARQLDLVLGDDPHLLQIGGEDVPWQFVSLPSGGPCRVFITPNVSRDPRSGPLRVLVTSSRQGAEMLMEFMARDSMRAAFVIADSQALALKLFEEKFEDPVAAIAGAYFLLRTDGWENVPPGWWSNLSTSFNLPDASILHCVRLLRGGLSKPMDAARAISLFRTSLDRGWPVYEEGLQLLQEASALLRSIAAPKDILYLSAVDALSTAAAWAGASLSFYGLHPAKPSAVLWKGMPGQAVRAQAGAAGDEVIGALDGQDPLIPPDGSFSASSILSAVRRVSSTSFVSDLKTPAVLQEQALTSDGLAGFRPGMYAARKNAAPVGVNKKFPARGGELFFLGDIGT
jgi:hypothetical protein